MTLQYKVVQKTSGTLIAACQRADDAVRVAEGVAGRECVIKWAGKIVYRAGEVVWSAMGACADFTGAGRLVAARVAEINRQAYDKDYGPGAYGRMIARMDLRREIELENSMACESVKA
jgi:hypothetical protein